MRHIFLHTFVRFCMLVSITVAIACSDDQFDTIITRENESSYTSTNTAPIPGNNGIISVSTITQNTAILHWSYAEDNSPAVLLQYQVVVSQTLTPFSLQEIIQSGLLNEDNWSTQPINQIILTNLARGNRYYANVCVRDPDHNISIYYPVSFTTKGFIYLFTAGSYTGDLAHATYHNVTIVSVRDIVNQLCNEALEDKYPFLPQDNCIALISIDEVDSIKNIPANYPNFPTDWPVYSAEGFLIAYTWQDLMDASIIDTLENTGVCDSFWWSGSLADGSCDIDNTCNGWTNGTNQYKGRGGAHNKNDSNWISYTTQVINCNNERYLLGLCW